jgi:hypothetical protein
VDAGLQAGLGDRSVHRSRREVEDGVELGFAQASVEIGEGARVG